MDCFCKDLEWWIVFLFVFNGIVCFLEICVVCFLMMDVCNLGGGGYFYGDYFYVNWVLDLFEVVDKYINIKEILIIVLGFVVF